MDASPSIADLWKILLLRTEAFDSVGRSKTGLWLSLRMFFLAGLIASIGILAGGLAEAGQVTFSDQLSTAASSMATTASGWPQRLTPQLAATMTTLAGRLQGAAETIASVQPPLGSSASQVLRAVGAWASQPILALTTWMSLLLPVFLAARLMGGRGSLRRQVSLVLLAFLPQALVFLSSFNFEPGTSTAAAATALRLGAALWSLVLLITALAVANEFSRGQAAKVIIVTAVVLVAAAGLLGLLADRLAGPVLSRLL